MLSGGKIGADRREGMNERAGVGIFEGGAPDWKGHETSLRRGAGGQRCARGLGAWILMSMMMVMMGERADTRVFSGASYGSWVGSS